MSEELTLTNVMNFLDSFVNRQDQIKKLISFLEERQFRFISICGEGGVGKTTLARELIRLLVPRNSFYAIVWTTAKEKELTVKTTLIDDFLRKPPTVQQENKKRSHEDEIVESLDDLFVAIAHHSQHPEFVLPRRNNLRPSEDDILTWLKIRRILVVIDDLDGWMDEWSSVLNFAEQVRPPSAILITSRYQLDRNSLPGLAQINLGPLTNSDAKKLLQKFEIAKSISLTPKQETEIIEFASGNPLLLSIATGLSQSLELPQSGLSDILKKAGKNKSTVQFLFDRLYNGLTSNAKQTAFVIALAHDENYPNLTLEGIAEASDMKLSIAESAINELKMASFIDRDPTDRNDFDMHKLAIDFVISQNPGEKRLRERVKDVFGGQANYGVSIVI